MTLLELTEEYQAQGIGARILDEIRILASRVVSNYSPQVYADVSGWNEGLDDLVQEFVTTVLLEEGQLDYTMLHASDLDHFRRLLTRQLRHLLARRRRRTVIDNLLDRCKTIAASAPFTQHSSGTQWSYSLGEVEAGRSHSLARESVLRATAAKVSMVPIVRSRGLERAPKVYSDASIKVILQIVAEEAGGEVSNSDLSRVFSFVLTHWIPSLLIPDEGVLDSASSATLSPECYRTP